jgi:anti-sigma regulatory factor (Ser/Thr protein kinase)
MGRPSPEAEPTVQLPAHPRSVARARRFVVEAGAAARLPDDLRESAALLVSELVTNAVVHGGTTTTVRVGHPAGRFRVSVQDESTAAPATGAPDGSQTSGRGLQIVAGLADRWGVDLTDRGKSVWFELSLPRR